MSSDEMKAIIRRFVDEPWNQRNYAVFDEILDPDYRVSSSDGKSYDRAQFKEFFHSRKPDPNFHAAVDDIIVEGDMAAYGWTMTTLDEAGKPTKTVGITILRFKNGRIIEDRFVSEDVKAPQPAS